MPKEIGNHSQHIVQQEATPQTSPERPLLPAILDVLERSVKAEAAHWAGWEGKTLSERMKSGRRSEAVRQQLAEEFARLSTEVTGRRDKLIVEVFTTLSSIKGGGVYIFGSLGMDETRKFIARVGLMNEDELREELRKAQEVREEYVQSYRRQQDTRRRNVGLTPEERDQRRREDNRENSRRYRQRRKERARLQTDQHQLTQVFSDPPKSNLP